MNNTLNKIHFINKTWIQTIFQTIQLLKEFSLSNINLGWKGDRKRTLHYFSSTWIIGVRHIARVLVTRLNLNHTISNHILYQTQFCKINNLNFNREWEAYASPFLDYLNNWRTPHCSNHRLFKTYQFKIQTIFANRIQYLKKYLL